MTAYESASLVTQWISAVAAIFAVAVAIVFGWLTLLNNRRSKDAQERASFAAADAAPPPAAEFAHDTTQAPQVTWAVEPRGTEAWLLRNTGTITAFEVTVAGLTDLDNRRLQADSAPIDIPPTDVLPFDFVSRLSLSGPGNLVIEFAVEHGGQRTRQVVRVPAQ
ncbi:hypothetical protein ACX9R5_04885 [Rathayibacter sp. CAU 1779]